MKSAYGVFSRPDGRSNGLRRMLQMAAPSDPDPFVVSTSTASFAPLARSDEERGDTLLSQDGATLAVVGKVYHEQCDDPRQTLRFLHGLFVTGDLDRLAECYGEFVLIFADAASDEIVLASDYLSIRPFFYTEQPQGTVFGSDVWPMLASGLIAGEVNLDALSAWMCLEHVLERDSLISGVHRLPPASIVTISPNGTTARRYVTMPVGQEDVTPDDLLARIHGIVRTTCAKMSSQEPSLGCFLSGGFDSRYLLCALGELRDDLEVYTVGYDSRERDVAELVREALDLSVKAINPAGSIYDLFDEPFYFSPWGFPAYKFVETLPVAQFDVRHPVVDGLLGDDVLRGYDFEVDVVNQRRELGSVDEAIFRAHLAMDPSVLLSADLCRRVRARVLTQIRRFRETVGGDEVHQSYQWLLFNRKNTLHVTNHLHNVDRLETVHPFATRALVELRLGHPNRLFTTDLYRELFRRYYPKVGAIPHSTDLEERGDMWQVFSRALWRRLPHVTQFLLGEGARGGFRTSWVVPRLGAYGLGMRKQLYLMRFLWPITMLAKRLRHVGIEVPWRDI